ncbi:glycosyltransferase [Cetobacterium somerae]|uniref:glycosyltransferase n=1 Tax=Cetobacterium somerae TaxID=188913 RepID=UPI003D7695F1
MKVSLIVPVYNRLEHLRAQFQCLLNQEILPFEVIITDDGSKENVLDYISDLLPKAKFKVKHVYQEDKGFRKTRALNNGVKVSEGDFLIFCDQDLVFGSDYIKTVIENASDKEFINFRPINLTENERNKFIKLQENGEIDYSSFIKGLPTEYVESVKRTLKKDRNRRIFNRLKLKKRGIKLVGMSYAVSKENYIKVNGYDEKYQGWGYEDDDFGNRLYAAGITGKEGITKDIQLHLWHHMDPTKKISQNEEYYAKRREEVLEKKDYFCEYGYNNSYENDEVIVKILKEV